MRRMVLWVLAAASLGGLSWAVSGCSSREGVLERRRRASLDLERLSPDGMQPPVEGESPFAAPEVATPSEAAPEEPALGAGAAASAEEPAASRPRRRGAVSSLLAASEGETAGEPSRAEEPTGTAGEAERPREAGARKAAGVRPSGDEVAAALETLREEGAVRRAEARHYEARGNEYFQQARYSEAYEAYRRAVEGDPSLETARRRLAETQFLLGERVGEVPTVSRAYQQEEAVSRQLQEAQTRRLLAQAQAALEALRVDEAERAAQKAIDSIRAMAEFDPAERQKAEDLLTTIRREKKRLEEERREELLREAKARAEKDVEAEAGVRYRTVQQLLRRARDVIELKDYEKAIEICERILELDPTNLVAKYWIADSREQLIKQRRLRLIEDRLENEKLAQEAFAAGSIPYTDIFVFPEDDYWGQVRKRSQAMAVLATEDPEWIRRIKNALDGTRVNLLFDETPLDDVVQQIRTFTGIAIMVDPQVDSKSLTVSMNLQGLTAAQALRLVLDNVGLAYTFRENVLFITSPGQETGRSEFAIYNVSDLLNKIRDFPGPEILLKSRTQESSASISFTQNLEEEEGEEITDESLVELVKQSSGGEEAWGNHSIEVHNGQLLVNAPRELHAEVQKVLTNLRRDSDLFVVIEARFIDINDDFLEDIGIDSRSLAAGNNLGTAWGNVINNTQTGGRDLGFTEEYTTTPDPELVMGQDRWAGRIQHILDGFTGTIRGQRLTAGGVGGLTVQSTWLEPFQINVILRAVQERSKARQLTAPVVTAHNGQRVYVSVVTQRAYIADYNLVSGGTGYSIIEVADPEVATFQEGVILDVDPVISPDRKYITMDVRPTLATLIGGVISTILISLGSFTNVAFQVPIGVPQISLQQSFTSVTVPNGGTVLLGGFKSLSESKYTSYIPLLGKVPLLANIFRRKAMISEKRSLIILITARIVDLRGEEAEKFNPE